MKYLALLLLAAPAFSQTVSLIPSVATGTGVTPHLTWTSTPAGASCTASGDAAWTGAKAANGTQTLANITTSKTYTLTCTWAGDNTATLEWTPPTKNADGSNLTNLAGFKIYFGTSAAGLTQFVDVPGATKASYVQTGLPVGTRYFALTAYNSLGIESAFSATVSKTITAGGTAADSASYQFPGSTILTVK